MTADPIQRGREAAIHQLAVSGLGPESVARLAFVLGMVTVLDEELDRLTAGLDPQTSAVLRGLIASYPRQTAGIAKRRLTLVEPVGVAGVPA